MLILVFVFVFVFVLVLVLVLVLVIVIVIPRQRPTPNAQRPTPNLKENQRFDSLTPIRSASGRSVLDFARNCLLDPKNFKRDAPYRYLIAQSFGEE